MTAPTTHGTAAGTAGQPDLTGFLLAHKGMRQEFGLLGAAARDGLDAERRALWEEHCALVLDTLHHHHTAEDDTIWPWLRARVPSVVPELDRLEAEHAEVDPLVGLAGDRGRPLAARADALSRLHVLVNAHLDREERVAVPLIRTHVTVAEWEALGERAVREMGRRNVPKVYGWYASAATAEEREEALATIPVVARVLFRLFWWPSYARRARRLYGAHAPATVAAP